MIINIVYGKDKFFVLREKEISLYILDDKAYKRSGFQTFKTSDDAQRVFTQIKNELQMTGQN